MKRIMDVVGCSFVRPADIFFECEKLAINNQQPAISNQQPTTNNE
jgi:hypothetical protein